MVEDDESMRELLRLHLEHAGYEVAVTEDGIGAGYAVLMCNPRGSAGYGQAHGKAIQGGFGTLTAEGFRLTEGGEVQVTVKDGKPAFELTPAPPKVKPKKAKKAAPSKKPAASKPTADTGEDKNGGEQ